MSMQNVNTKCAVCSVESKMKCSNCANAFYCSVAHQKDNWKVHKKECYPIQVRINFHYLKCLGLIRCIIFKSKYK